MFCGSHPVTYSPYHKYIYLEAQNEITFLPSNHKFPHFAIKPSFIKMFLKMFLRLTTLPPSWAIVT